MGDCITPLRLTGARELLERPDWRKRLEIVPKRLTDSPDGDLLMFDKDRRRWRHRLRYYKEVRIRCIIVPILWKRYLMACFRILRFRLSILDSLYMFLWWGKIALCIAWSR